VKRLAVFGGVALVLLVGGWLAVRKLVPDAPTEPLRVTAPPRPTAPAADAGRAADETVRVAAVNGPVERRLPGRPWRPAAAGASLSRTEAVRTGPEATAELTVGGGSRLEIAGATEVAVREIAEASHRFRLHRGRLSVDHQPAGQRVIQIESRDGQAMVQARSARFYVMGTGGALAVATDRGTATLQAQGKAVDVHDGHQSVAVAGSPPADPVAIPKEVLLRIAGLGRRVRVAQSSTLVEGQTQPGNRVLVGGRPVDPDGNGRFGVRVPLTKGAATTVRVVAEAPSGGTKAGEVTYVMAKNAADAKRKGSIRNIDIRWGK
jgi:hypothetical protein